MKEEINFKIRKEDFPALVQEIVDTYFPQEKLRFISEEEARQLLNCGKTQIYIYRVRGKVGFTQDPDHPKQIMYDRESIEAYLLSNLKEPF